MSSRDLFYIHLSSLN